MCCIPRTWAFCPCREASCLGRKAAWSFILNGVIVNVAVGSGISSNRCCYSISTCFLLRAEAATLAAWLFLIFVREKLDLCSRRRVQTRLALLLLVHPPVVGWEASVPKWRNVAGLMMFKCHYTLQKSDSAVRRTAWLMSTPEDGNGGNVRVLQIIWFFNALGTTGHATVWDLDFYLHKILLLVPLFFFFFKFCHHFSDLKIHTFFEGWGSLPRMGCLFSISKLPLSFFSPRSLLLPSYILCWREQSRLIFSIWFDINREDSKGKTNAGGNDGFRLSSFSLCKRINRNLESMLLLCVWSEIVQPLCFTLLRPSALSSRT